MVSASGYLSKGDTFLTMSSLTLQSIVMSTQSNNMYANVCNLRYINDTENDNSKNTMFLGTIDVGMSEYSIILYVSVQAHVSSLYVCFK